MTTTVRRPKYRVSRSRIMKRVCVKMECPRCSESLTVGQAEVGQPDHCPTCGQDFTLSRRRLDAFLEQEAEIAATRSAALVERKRRAAEARKALQEARKAQQEDRRRKDAAARRQRLSENAKAYNEYFANQEKMHAERHARREATGGNTITVGKIVMGVVLGLVAFSAVSAFLWTVLIALSHQG